MGAVAEAPAVTPVGVDEAKAYLRIEGEEEDALIAGLVRSATALCEGFCGQALIARAVTETVPAAAVWRRLSVTPVRAIAGIEGLPATGAGFALPVEAYAVDIDVHGDGWVRMSQPGSATRIAVTYQAGLAADWNGVPEPLRQGIIRLVAHLFSQRDGPGDGAEPPTAVAALWRPWRRMRLQ